MYLHFSGISYIFFLNNTFRLSLGTLLELMPLATIGCIYSSKSVLLVIKNLSFHYCFIFFYLVYFLFKFDIVILSVGFRYPNIILNILGSTALLLSFCSISFNNELINVIINNITKFTGGIYCIHMIIRDYLQKYVSFFAKRTYFSSSLIYIICFWTCFLFNKLFKNYKLK